MEQARRSTLAHHVYRITPMGTRVLINGTWYYCVTRGLANSKACQERWRRRPWPVLGMTAAPKAFTISNGYCSSPSIYAARGRATARQKSAERACRAGSSPEKPGSIVQLYTKVADNESSRPHLSGIPRAQTLSKTLDGSTGRLRRPLAG
jgi:hypothetical protein